MDFFEQAREFLEEHRALLPVMVAAAVCCLLVPRLGGIVSEQSQGNVQLESGSGYSSADVVSSSAFSQSRAMQMSGSICVDVKGAVRHPGVYRIASGKRVGDVLGLAGGTVEGADTNQINFAFRLEDQMVIYVPKYGESPPVENAAAVTSSAVQTQQADDQSAASRTQNASTGQDQGESGKININTATKDQLTQLSGIGDKRADDIIAYREQHGGFKSIDELKNVSGIGDKTFEKLSSQITV